MREDHHKNGAKYQLVEPPNHKLNVVEQEIRTGKKDIILGLSSVYLNFSLYFGMNQSKKWKLN